MKILFSYPPLDTAKGFPTLGQNRQFQYFTEPTHIYPVVPATAATLLRDNGHEVLWNDCAAEGIAREDYFKLIEIEKPDLIVFETKTPVVKEHWELIDEIKCLPITDHRSPITVLIGDHVTALPEESMQNSQVDFVLTGGDYDFLLLNLCKNSSLQDHKSPIPNPQSLESGIWYRDNEQIKNTGPFKLNNNLDDAPFIDRDLTKWELYAYKNGNYRRIPGTYIMSGRDCWWGKCTFCSWPQLYPKFRVRSVENVLDEIGMIIENYPVREIMDDTGTFPRGEWLRSFCRGAIERGFRKKIGLDCNFRFGAATLEDYRLMKEAGFRFLLFGLESGNQDTLNRLKKNMKIETIIESCRAARKAGLYPHITIMFGYPWESYEEATKTFELGRWLLRKGYAYTMQATVVVPYPGTPLYQECRDKNWLLTDDWADFDMKKPVMKTPFSGEELMKLVQGMYSIAFDPVFLAHKIMSIRDWSDIRFFLRAGKKVFGHLKDFK
ncbi:MAG: radical SAM protein [Candidatus Euphemobacter frigidus]|nr:radical SAM protein [Candidatus Euphemobacter frigidus]MDP8275311.1 radical SAM protein [Candidatus Euphemobacter frigidus]